MENLDNNVSNAKNNHAQFTETSGTGVAGSLIFMGIAFLLMVIISTFMH